MRLRTAYTILGVKAKLEASEWPFVFSLTDYDHPESVIQEDTIAAHVEILDPQDENVCLRTYYLALDVAPDSFDVYVRLDQDTTELLDWRWTVYDPRFDIERLDDKFSDVEVDEIVTKVLDGIAENERVQK